MLYKAWKRKDWVLPILKLYNICMNGYLLRLEHLKVKQKTIFIQYLFNLGLDVTTEMTKHKVYINFPCPNEVLNM